MANAILESPTNDPDDASEILQCVFGHDFSIQDGYWIVTEVSEGIGRTPGTATVLIPNNIAVVDESAGSVVLNPDGPLGVIKHGTPAGIFKKWRVSDGWDSQFMFAGTVERIGHDIARDAVKLTILDDRHALKDVRVVGRFIIDVENGNINYQNGWGSHFNPEGRPNCGFDRHGIPVFTPYPDYGLSRDQDVPGADIGRILAAQGSFVSVYWTLELIMEHLWFFYGPEIPSVISALVERVQSLFPEYRRLPDWIGWPQGFGSNLDSISISNFDNGTGQNYSVQGGGRKGRDISADGLALVGSDSEDGLFDMLFSGAGGWTWTLQYIDRRGGPEGPRCVLISIPQRPINSATAVPMYFACGGAAKETLKAPCITDGLFEESSEFTMSRAIGRGSLIKIETRVEEDLSSPDLAPLLPAWSADDEDALKTLAVVGGVSSDELFEKAATTYPDVWTKWRLNPRYDFTTGTEFSSYLYSNVPRPVWPFLLSFRGGSSDTTRDIIPYEIRTEVHDGSGWKLGPALDGLEVWDNGIIRLPAMREVAKNQSGYGAFRWTNGVAYETDGTRLRVTRQKIRFTVALPLDHRLGASVRTNVDSNGLNPMVSYPYQIRDDSPDVDRLDVAFSKTIVVDLNFLYECWLRLNSYPVPEATPGTMAEDFTGPEVGNALRTDIELLRSHVDRILYDRFRLKRSGPLVFGQSLVLNYPPGTEISEFRPLGAAATRRAWPAKCVVQRRRWLCTPMMQEGRLVYNVRTEHYFA